eukprot:3785396-Rhodomonas_salina.2
MYAMSGTETAYTPTPSGTDLAYGADACAWWLEPSPWYCLLSADALPGTDTAYTVPGTHVTYRSAYAARP